MNQQPKGEQSPQVQVGRGQRLGGAMGIMGLHGGKYVGLVRLSNDDGQDAPGHLALAIFCDDFGIGPRRREARR